MNAGKGCLLLIALAIGLGVFCFQTELGWTLLYSFGHFEPDMRQVVVDNGLQPKSVSARMFLGSRSGYAWVVADDAGLEKFAQTLEAKDGFAPYPDPKLSVEDRVLFSRIPTGFPDSERPRYEQALAEGKARAVFGRETRSGSLQGFFFIFIPGEGRGVMTSGYPYG